jgi:hypothetical protein
MYTCTIVVLASVVDVAFRQNLDDLFTPFHGDGVMAEKKKDEKKGKKKEVKIKDVSRKESVGDDQAKAVKGGGGHWNTSKPGGS